MCWRLHDKAKKMNEKSTVLSQTTNVVRHFFSFYFAELLWWWIRRRFFISRETTTQWLDRVELLSRSFCASFNSSTKTNSTQSSNYQLSESFSAIGFLLCSDEKLISSFYSPQWVPDGGWQVKSYFLFQSSLETFYKSLIILRAFIDEFFSGFQLVSSVLWTMTGIVNCLFESATVEFASLMMSQLCLTMGTNHSQSHRHYRFLTNSKRPRSSDVVNYIHDIGQRGEEHSEN